MAAEMTMPTAANRCTSARTLPPMDVCRRCSTLAPMIRADRSIGHGASPLSSSWCSSSCRSLRVRSPKKKREPRNHQHQPGIFLPLGLFSPHAFLVFRSDASPTRPFRPFFVLSPSPLAPFCFPSAALHTSGQSAIEFRFQGIGRCGGRHRARPCCTRGARDVCSQTFPHLL